MPSYEQLVEVQYLRVCTPQMAYEWLAGRPRDTFMRYVPGFVQNEAEAREVVLLHRNDPLIDYGLARFGMSPRVARTLYDRLDPENRKVMRARHRAAGGPAKPFIEGDPNEPVLLDEMACWVSNSDLDDDRLTELFTRSGPFEKLNDDNYLRMVGAVSVNDRLRKQYQSEYLDGYDDYKYHKPIKAVWDLLSSVPTTQAWATTLWQVLDHTISTGATVDAVTMLARWRIDDKPENPDAWHAHSPSFYLRAIIARHMPQGYDRLRTDDMAVRCAFYRSFSPSQYPDWPAFLDRDGEVFFHYALDNERLWLREATREQLYQVAWAVKDPHHDMGAQNLFRSVQKRKRELHPEWFVKENEPEMAPIYAAAEPEPPPPVEAKEDRRIFRF